MNDIEKQEQEPSTPEQAGSTESSKNADSQEKAPKTSQKTAIFALILALAGLVLGYVKLDELDSALQQEREELADLKKQQLEGQGRLDKSNQAIAAQQTAFTKQDERLKLQAEEMSESLELVYERVGRSSTQWLVAEAEYLMRIANHRLLLEGDSKTALVALERADKRLHDSGDPIWTPIREKLASEMAELRGLQELDIAGQAAKLSGLISQVDKLKLPQSVSITSSEPESNAEEEKEFSFDTVLEDFWAGVKSLLKVRRSDRPVTAMLEPDQAFFLYQNLRLQLEASRVALLRGDKSLFDASLQRVGEWIKEFFDQEHAVTKSMLRGVAELAKLDLEAKRPDISGSLRMLLQQQGRDEEEPESEQEEQQPTAEEPLLDSAEQKPEEAVSESADKEQKLAEEDQPEKAEQERAEEEEKPATTEQKEEL
jgi:uroporphyrin-3 C-methyltransferase